MEYLMSNETINSLFYDSVEKHNSQLYAIIYPSHEKITYSDLRERVKIRQTQLSSKDERIVFYMENSLEWVVNFLAVVCSGRCAIILDGQLDPSDIRHQLEQSQADLIITTKSKKNTLLKYWENTEYAGVKPKIFVVDEPHDMGLFNQKIVAPSPDTVAVVMYTSGSTGHPKGVELTHRALVQSVFYNVKKANIPSFSRHLALASFNHIAGLIIVLLLPISMGGIIIFISSLRPTIILSAIRECQVNALLAPPVFFEMLHHKIIHKIMEKSLINRLTFSITIKFFKYLIFFNPRLGLIAARKFFKKIHQEIGENLQLIFSGGARLRNKVMRNLTSLGYDLRIAYGLSETAGPIVLTKQYDLHDNCVGTLNENVEIKIDQPDSSVTGQILVKSAQLMNGYYNQPDKTAEVMSNGWFKTGDLGYIRKNYLYILGRINEIIILPSGKKIYPDDVEHFFRSIKGIKELCIIGLPFEGNSRLALIVTPHFSNNKKNDYNDLLHNLEIKNSNLPPQFRVQNIFIQDEDLPKTKFHKIKRPALVEKYKYKIEDSPY